MPRKQIEQRTTIDKGTRSHADKNGDYFWQRINR